MDFKVLGCHGGESPKHQCPAFLLDGRVCLDAGSITNMLTLKEQQKIEAVVVSHAHIDHVRDLAMLADTRTQQGGPPLTIASTPGTIAVLKKPLLQRQAVARLQQDPGSEATAPIVFQKLAPEQGQRGRRLRGAAGAGRSHGRSRGVRRRRRQDLARLQRRHRADRAAVGSAAARSAKLSALIMEVAFPNEQAELARDSGHHTPRQPRSRSCASSTPSSATCRCCCSTSSRCSSARSRSELARSARATTRSCRSATSTCCRLAVKLLCSRGRRATVIASCGRWARAPDWSEILSGVAPCRNAGALRV